MLTKRATETSIQESPKRKKDACAQQQQQDQKEDDKTVSPAKKRIRKTRNNIQEGLNLRPPPVSEDEILGVQEMNFLRDCITKNQYGDAKLFYVLYKQRIAWDWANDKWYLWTGDTFLLSHGKHHNILSTQLRRQYRALYSSLDPDSRLHSEDETAFLEEVYQRLEEVCTWKYTKGILNYAKAYFGMSGVGSISYLHKQQLGES